MAVARFITTTVDSDNPTALPWLEDSSGMMCSLEMDVLEPCLMSAIVFLEASPAWYLSYLFVLSIVLLMVLDSWAASIHPNFHVICFHFYLNLVH